jgi:hypothetical protein
MSEQPLDLEVRGDWDRAVTRALPALAALLLDVARRRAARRRLAQRLLTHCYRLAAERGLTLPPA